LINSSPYFSVVIATYNRAKLLKNTIASIRNQTFDQFELLIVDDGSTDSTGGIVKEMATQDNRIRYLHQENAERGAARNNGYRNSAGMFVVFFDSDDFMTPEYLQELHDLTVNNPGYTLYAGKHVFEENGKTVLSSVSTYPPKAYGIELVLDGNPIGTLFCVRRGNGFIPFPENRELAAMEDWMCLVYNLRNSKLLLGDFVGCRVNNHDERSMNFNQPIIKKRLLACNELLQTMEFSEQERSTMLTFTYHFCAIHAYLDLNRKQALHFLKKAMATGGMKKQFLITFAKIVVGKNTINQIKKLK
jgi:glycosyltransferase involved in cell wall biosynthesis